MLAFRILDFYTQLFYNNVKVYYILQDFGVISLSVTLQTAQREQAGSDTYNRYEYQVHWIVGQIVSRLDSNPNCVIFCEYHDDMAELADPDKDIFEYYQVKTKENCDEWSVVELSQKIKRKDNTYKRSFLGFVFYNFMQFGMECARCTFVTNAPLDKEIRTWQACIEDENDLKVEQPDIYSKIKKRISEEYGNAKPNDFDAIFDRFIQNTFVLTDTLQLNTYEEQTRGRFFTYLQNQTISTDTANLVLEQIIKDVRKKSKEPINPPISKKSLVLKKGIRVADISTLLKSKQIKSDTYAAFRVFLINSGLTDPQIDMIVARKTIHDVRWNDIEDANYQTCIMIIRSIIALHVARNQNDFKVILSECFAALSQKMLTLTELDENLVEVLYYERKYANGKK